MQKNPVPFLVAALLVSMAAMMLSLLTYLRQGDLRAEVAALRTQLAAERMQEIQGATGRSLPQLLQDLGAPPESPPGEAPGQER